jgi:endonuclease/exonuclease/phosphatase family metal-dependent hydrolase
MLRHFFILLSLCGALLCATPRFPSAAHNSSPAKSRTLRVMTYNIHVGVGMDKKLDLVRIAEVINHEHPDLVGLQEVDRGVERTGRVDEVAELAQLTRMDYAFAPNLRFQGGWYGVAVLSRLPILATDHRRYQNLREAERRGFIRVEVDNHGQLINFVTTHLDYQYEDGRVFETEQLMKALAKTSGPLIIVGDFNDEPSGTAYKLMRTRFADALADLPEQVLTFPADKPTKRIDYIFYPKNGGLSANRSWTVKTLASDHLPFVADLELK